MKKQGAKHCQNETVKEVFLMAKKKETEQDLYEYEDDDLSEYETEYMAKQAGQASSKVSQTKKAYLQERVRFLSEKIMWDQTTIRGIQIRVDIAEKLLGTLKTELRKEV